MPKVSVNILTKNRAKLLPTALGSVLKQSFSDLEIVVINDGSTDETEEVLQGYKDTRIQVVNHQSSLGITQSRQEALEKSAGQYVAILDDDDAWTDADKLKKQVEFLDAHPQCVIAGGGIQIENSEKRIVKRTRPEADQQIRKTMLFRNNFFTSTVIFRKDAAIKAGGFVKDGIDLAEDYDLWLRMGKLGQMYNFQETFVDYRPPSYNKDRFMKFLLKQRYLIKRQKKEYSFYFFARLILNLRLIFFKVTWLTSSKN